VLIVDEPHPRVDYAAQPFETLFAADLGVPGFENFALRYSILELNTAVKPYLLAHLGEQHGCRRLCYFDPDILVVGELSALYHHLDQAPAVLTPHILEPLEDGFKPGERDLLLSGVYNLGFLGLRLDAQTRSFLGWWQRKLHGHCLHRVADGLFVDQRWMDFAPAFLPDVKILRDPGYNVAYWNLAHRRLRRQDGEWQVGGASLRFFHFSGYDCRRPDEISKHQDRYTFADRPDLKALFDEYRRRLEAEGFLDWVDLPYAYGRFDNGVPIPDAARRLLQSVDPDGRRWPRPAQCAERDSFFSWLLAPPRAGLELPLPRLALQVWDERDDVQRAFPEPTGAGLVRFAKWFVTDGLIQAGIDSAFVRLLTDSLAARRDPDGARLRSGPGVEETEEGLRLTPGVFWERAEFQAWVCGLDAEALARLLGEASAEAGTRPLIPRLALAIHRQRADLQRDFPQPLGASRRSFAVWYVTSGWEEYGLPLRLVRPVLVSLSLRARMGVLLWWLRRWRAARD